MLILINSAQQFNCARTCVCIQQRIKSRLASRMVSRTIEAPNSHLTYVEIPTFFLYVIVVCIQFVIFLLFLFCLTCISSMATFHLTRRLAAYFPYHDKDIKPDRYCCEVSCILKLCFMDSFIYYFYVNHLSKLICLFHTTYRHGL